MPMAQYQHLHYHWDINANSSWNSQCESWRKSDSTRLGHAHQLSRIWDPKWVFLKAHDNPIVVWQGFLNVWQSLIPQRGWEKKSVRVSNLGDSRKSRKFAGNSEFPGYFEAALYHSPQDIHKARTTPRTASEDPFQTIQEPLLLECWRCFRSPWRHPETVKNSGSKRSKEKHIHKKWKVKWTFFLHHQNQ